MREKTVFQVLVGTDGSRVAGFALDAVIHFPWPDMVRVSAVVARRPADEFADPAFRDMLARPANLAADRAARRLAARWPDAQVQVREGAPESVILGEAGRIRCDVIAVGWRGHGPVRRLLAGSVSRAVVRRAHCSVLVVRHAVADYKRIVIGHDGSAHSDAAVGLVGRLRPPRGGRVTLVTAIDGAPMPAHPGFPAPVRRGLAAEVARINEERSEAARAKLAAPAAALEAAGWKVDPLVVTGAPLRQLFDQVLRRRAHLLVVGATGVTGLDRVLLGSVAEGALNRSPVPILIAR